MKTICTAILLLALANPIAPAMRNNTLNMTLKEFKCLSENVYHEARGEPFQGQLMVAKVTLNRAGNKDICSVVYAKHQFSWTAKPTSPKDKEAMYVARHAAATAHKHPTQATHYHTRSVKPAWSRKLKRLQVVGNHIFYKEHQWIAKTVNLTIGTTKPASILRLG